MDKPRIAFVTPGTFQLPSPNSSSVERVVEKTVPLLVPHIEAYIYGRIGKKLGKHGSVGGATIERFPAANKVRYIGRVKQAIKKLRPDLLQVENRPRFVLQLKEAQPNNRIWLNLHSSTFIREGAISAKTLAKCFHAAERIIVNSDYLRDDAAARVPECAHKLRVVYPGVDVSRFQSQHSFAGEIRRNELRKKRQWEGRSVVLFMGRLQEIKGVHHLLKLMPELIKEHPSVLLVIVGGAFYGSTRTTPYVRSLYRQARKLKGHVKFVPYAPHSEVPDWFLAADVAVVPSGSREAFGLVNVEAMSCGLPVVATRAGGMKEIIQDDITGYLVDPAQVVSEMRLRILKLLRDDALRGRMGRLSRDRVEHMFTWQHSAKQWLELLSET